MGGPNTIDPRTSLVPQAPPPAPPTSDGQFRDGARTGTTVGRFEGGELRAGQRAQQDFGSYEAAAAYARGAGQSMVVVAEQGRYAVYRVEEANNGAWFLSSGAQIEQGNAATAVASDPGVVGLVTDDNYFVDLTPGGGLQLGGPTSGPYAGRNAAFGPGLASLTDRAQFEREYEAALRDTAFTALDQGERAARDAQGRLQGDAFTTEDRAAIARVTGQLNAVDARIAQTEAELRTARDAALRANLDNMPYADPYGGMPMPLPETPAQVAANAEVTRLQQQLAAQQQERIAAAQEFPLLLRVENLAEFSALPEAQQVATLRAETDQVLADIATTRENLVDGDFNLWTNDALRATVNAGLGIEGERAQWVQDKATSEGRWEAATSIGTAVLGVGLAVGGAALAPFSGGTSLAASAAGVAMIGGGVAIGVYDAVNVTQGYLRDQAAVNTALDPNAGLLPPDAAGHWGWVALAWVGAGVDAVQAVGAVAKLARAGQTVETLIGNTPEAQRALSEVATELGVSPAALRAALTNAGTTAFDTRVLSSADFSRAFGSQSAEAVTLVNRMPDGSVQVEVVFRDGLSPAERLAALGEETTHLRQLADPARAQQAAALSESNLARWADMAPAERLAAYRANLELEIDAARGIADDAGATTAQRAQAAERLEAMQGRLDEVNRGLDGGPVPAWIATAQPPRLFSDPIYPTNNAAAQALGMPPPPDGHYYRNLGNGRYELTRFPEGSSQWVDPDIAPPQRLVRNDDGSWALRDDTSILPADRRAQLETRFGEPLRSPEGQALERSFAELGIESPYLRAYARQYADAFADLRALGGDPQAVLRQMAGHTGANPESVMRAALRTQTVDAIRALPPTDQMAALQRAADALPPANRLRGELFTAFRESAMPPGITRVEAPTNGVVIDATGRQADGLVDVSRLGDDLDGPANGRFLVEDKFASSFNPEQARAYSAAFDNAGNLATRDGASADGLVYVFSSPEGAAAAARMLEREGLHPNIHVAILEGPGNLTWLR